MTQLLRPRFLFSLLLTFSLTGVMAQSINFYEGAFSGLAKQAKATGKPFIVYFSMKECPSCEKMDTTSLNDAKVANYINEHFLIQKVDGFSLEQGGMEEAQHFQVTSFPTIMFFRSDCSPFYEVGGYIEAENLLGNLEKEYDNVLEMKRMANQNVSFCASHLQHFQPKAPVRSMEPSYVIEYPASFKNIVKPEEMIASSEKRGLVSREIAVKFNPSDLAANPYSQRDTDPIKGALDSKTEPKAFEVRFRDQEAMGSKGKSPKKKVAAPVEENTELEHANADIEPSSFGKGPKSPDMVVKSRGVAKKSKTPAGLYDISELPKAAYGVQIGAFTDKKTLESAIENYQTKLEEVYVTCETDVNGIHFYKLVVGAFENREDALNKKQELENELSVSGFILSYDKVR